MNTALLFYYIYFFVGISTFIVHYSNYCLNLIYSFDLHDKKNINSYTKTHL